MSREREPVSGEGEGEREEERKRVERETKKSWGGAGWNPWVQCVCPAEKMLVARPSISWPACLRFSFQHTTHTIPTTRSPTLSTPSRDHLLRTSTEEVSFGK